MDIPAYIFPEATSVSLILIGRKKFVLSIPIMAVMEQLDNIRKVKELNTTFNQESLIDIYRTFHSITAEYTFFSSIHGIYISTQTISKMMEIGKQGN